MLHLCTLCVSSFKAVDIYSWVAGTHLVCIILGLLYSKFWDAFCWQSMSVPHKEGDAYLPAGRNMSRLNISGVFHIDNVLTHSWSPIAYAAPPVSLSKQTARESWAFLNASWDCSSAAASMSFIWYICMHHKLDKTKVWLSFSLCQVLWRRLRLINSNKALALCSLHTVKLCICAHLCLSQRWGEKKPNHKHHEVTLSRLEVRD